MLWSVKEGDIIQFDDDIYRYEVKSVRKWVVLENCLLHKFSHMKLLTILAKAKLVRRSD
jgi:ASC-1-like (ASCH) protein